MLVPHSNRFTPTCDGCGAELAPVSTFIEGVNLMKLWGWLVERPHDTISQWYHFCPVCKERSAGNA